MAITYFKTIDEVIEIYLKTVEVSGGGTTGIISTSSLEVALEKIQDDLYYPSFVDKLTYLFFIANKGHCFQDGNKRIAISLGALFLLKNGYVLATQRFFYKMEMISYQLAAGNIDKDLLHEIIHSIVFEEDYCEELKLKLLTAIDTELNKD